eukprot:scaffold1637_cov195-Alexandrium_tamarense.AAC.1
MPSSAASKAAKSLGGSRRNRPSLSMSQNLSPADANEIASDLRDNSNNNIDSSGNGAPNSGSGRPLFMNELQSQYESLSERLARENELSSAPNSGGSTLGGLSSSGGKKKKNKVRWSETAALASTLDGANGEEDEDTNPRSPIDIISDLFHKKYTMPLFLVMATSIFLLVHLTGDDNGEKLYSSQTNSNIGEGTSSSGSVINPITRMSNRQYNIVKGDVFDNLVFSLTPTSTPGEDTGSEVPTMEVIAHTTPKITPVVGVPSVADDGNEPGWIVVPTSSKFRHGGGEGEGGDGMLKWKYPKGAPTPDPALLYEAQNNGGTPTSFLWNYGPGVPTPNPALLPKGSPNGSPTSLLWNYPPG